MAADDKLSKMNDLWVELRAEVDYAHACLIEMANNRQQCRSWERAPAEEQDQYVQQAVAMLRLGDGAGQDDILALGGERDWLYQTIAAVSSGQELPKLWSEMTSEEHAKYIDGIRGEFAQ